MANDVVLEWWTVEGAKGSPDLVLETPLQKGELLPCWFARRVDESLLQ